MKCTRRDVFALGAGGLLLSAAASRGADGPGESEIEQTNAKLVTDFCAAWSTLDVDKISAFLSDKIVYQMIDDFPLVKGKEAFVKAVGGYLAKVERAQWDVSRTHAIGNLVINQRVDNFFFKGNRPEAHFAVAGLFLLRDGKIVEWKDYRLPGEKK